MILNKNAPSLTSNRFSGKIDSKLENLQNFATTLSRLLRTLDNHHERKMNVKEEKQEDEKHSKVQKQKEKREVVW